MQIYLATDHAGFEMKEKIKQFLLEKGYQVEDLGAYEFDSQDDYPDYIKKAAKKISKNPNNFAIIFGGSGQGEAIVANRYKNVRAAVFYGCLNNNQTDQANNQLNIIESARAHNNANVLSIGARFVSFETAKQAVEIFLNTPFSGDRRHERRIKKIDDNFQFSIFNFQ